MTHSSANFGRTIRGVLFGARSYLGPGTSRLVNCTSTLGDSRGTTDHRPANQARRSAIISSVPPTPVPSSVPRVRPVSFLARRPR